jgi:hypothetical protein
MISDTLSRHFKGIAAKKLTAVEAHPERSNQHEFNGVAALKELFGMDGPLTKRARFVWLSDDDFDLASEDGYVTWYDARANHPTRSEHRLYFPTTSVTERASEGDTVLIARQNDDTVLVIIAASGSAAATQLLWLFGIQVSASQFVFREISGENDLVLGAAATFLLDQIGITPENQDDDLLAEMKTRFERGFPTTAEFSAFAQRSLGAIDLVRDPDAGLVALMDREEKLFRIFERHLLTERLTNGFMTAGEADVDGFVTFSLAVQNRRKSRVGHALEHHTNHVLEANNIRRSRNPVTENRIKPDFLLPGIEEYRMEGFPVERLTVLAVKSTCKDRWRQILTEAQRIPTKHLLTFEPGISAQQMEEMVAHRVQLVVPVPIQSTYSSDQRKELMSVARFIDLVRARE